MSRKEPPDTDPHTVEGATNMAREFARLAEVNFARDGVLLQVAFVMCERNPQTGEFLDGKLCPAIISPPQLGIPPGTPPQVEKDIMERTIRQIVDKGQAVAVIMVSECWMVDENSEEALEWVRAGKTLEHFPGRKEKAMLSLEHRLLGDQHKMWQADILRPDDAKPRLGNWHELPMGPSKGRFCGFFEKVA